MAIQYCKKCSTAVSDDDAVVKDYIFTCPSCGTQLVYFGSEQSNLTTEGMSVKPVDVKGVQKTTLQTLRPDKLDDVFLLIQADLDKNPKDLKALNQMAKYHRSHGEYKKAIEYCLTLIRLEPKQLQYYRSLADIYAAQKRYVKAVAVLKKMLTLAPEDEMVFYNLGIALVHTGKPKQALQAFDRAIHFTQDLSFCQSIRDIMSKLRGSIKTNDNS